MRSKLNVPGIKAPSASRPNYFMDSVPEDWSHEINYERLIQMPGVKDQIETRIPTGTKRTLEDFLTVPPGKRSIPGMVIQGIVGNFSGMRRFNDRDQLISAPCSKILVSVLCYLASSEIRFTSVQQGSEKCTLICKIPASIRSWQGELEITVTRGVRECKMEADTSIDGQIIDWGRSKSILQRLFEATLEGLNI